MNRITKEHNLKIEIEVLKENLNKELETTSLPNDNILYMSQELDTLIIQYIKSK